MSNGIAKAPIARSLCGLRHSTPGPPSVPLLYQTQTNNQMAFHVLFTRWRCEDLHPESPRWWAGICTTPPPPQAHPRTHLKNRRDAIPSQDAPDGVRPDEGIPVGILRRDWRPFRRILAGRARSITFEMGSSINPMKFRLKKPRHEARFLLGPRA